MCDFPSRYWKIAGWLRRALENLQKPWSVAVEPQWCATEKDPGTFFGIRPELGAGSAAQYLGERRAMGCGASAAKPHPLDYLQQLQAAPALQQLEYLQQLDSRLTAPTGVMVVPAMVPARRGVNAGVKMGWLKDFAKQVPPGMSTLDVVLTIIKPRTKERLCRFVALIAEQSPGSVGRARVFASHTWKAPFLDLVAALGHLLSDDDLVWIDVRPPARPSRARRRPLTRARRLSARRSSPFCSGTRRTACRRRKSRRRPRISTSRRSRLRGGRAGHGRARAGGHARGGGGADGH